MPQFSKKGPSKKSEYYLKDKSLNKEPRDESLRYKALENRVFYFDFKNTGTAAWLEKEIRKLGGRVDYFFGKDVHFLITDRPQTPRDGVIPPISPFSNAGPSPFSRPDTSQSRTPSEWAWSEQWKKPQQQPSSQLSRASKMLEFASTTKSQGSCDVYSRAKERGTTIKTVEQFTSWLNKVHQKLGTKLSRDSLKETPKNPSKKLQGHYIKVEDANHKYKPQILDAPQWQTIDLNSLSDQSPFSTEKRRITRKQAHEQNKPLESVKSILKKEVHKKKSGKGLIRRKGGGKCEGCNVRFVNLETHLSGEQHCKYAKKDKNFEAIDQIIAEGLSLEVFQAEESARMTRLQTSKSTPLANVLSPLSESSTEPLDGPCTRARRHKIVLQSDLHTHSPLVPSEQALTAPSPKLSGVPPELENNYYLRSTPRKMVGMLDEWDLPEAFLAPDQVSQVSVVSDGAFLQCQSLDLSSSQGQGATTQGDNTLTEYVIKRPRPSSPSKKHNVTPGMRTRSNSPASRSRNNSARNSPSLQSPNKQSPRQSSVAKRRTINHS